MFTTVADYMLEQRMKKVLVKDDAKYRRAPPAHAVNQVVEIWWRYGGDMVEIWWRYGGEGESNLSLTASHTPHA